MARQTKADRDKLATIRERFKAAKEADDENRRRAVEDLRFLHEPGGQTDDATKNERGEGRPIYEFNRTRVTCKRIVNEIRTNRPAGKVRSTKDSTRANAEIMEGLCRNLWSVSDGDSIIDAQAEYVVGAGIGAWRVATKYSSNDAWEQDIVLEPIENPLCLYVDPAAQDPMFRDARYWFLTTKMAKEVFEAKYPKAETADFEDASEYDDDDEWDDGERVRLVEYWWKTPEKRLLVLLPDGRTVDAEDLNGQIPPGVRTREVVVDRVRMCIASGSAILEEADWPGRQFPFVLVHGERVNIDGKRQWFGIARFAKDPQRAYNLARTATIETIAAAPQAKYWATANQAKGHTDKWAQAHKSLYPFMLYNADPAAPGPPQRMGGADVPVALIQEGQIAAEDLKAVTGVFDPSLGKQSNETSGIAISARQRQGEIVTFNFPDNVAKGIRRTWEILIDLIPAIYDGPRMVRVIGADGAEKWTQINQPDPVTGNVLNDLSASEYDVAVVTGPSFSTQRQEAAEVYMALLQGQPQIFPIIGDLVFKSLDLPYAEQIAERLKVIQPPEIQRMEAENGEAGQSPEVMAAMAQAEAAMQQVQLMGQEVQAAAQEAEKAKFELESVKADIAKQAAGLDVKAANLKVMEANIQTDVAQFKQLIAETQAKAAQTEGATTAEERVVLIGQVDQALQAINAQAEQFMQAAAGMLEQMQAITAQPVVVEKPTAKVVRMRRVNGGLEGIVVDQETGAPLRQVNVQRVGGELVGEVNEMPQNLPG